MSLQLLGAAMLSCIGGIGIGLAWGRRLWGPQWFDTSKGIDRKFRKLRF